MKKILVIEDDPNLGLGLKDNLEFEGYEVEVIDDGTLGMKAALSSKHDLLLLDIMLPGASGFEICKKMRSEGVKTPIILLTSKSEEIDKVRGLELGADDYVTKPFSLMELIARVKAVLRRYDQDVGEAAPTISVGNLTLDFHAYSATHLGKPVRISHKEFEIIRLLYDKKNEVVSREMMLNEVWGYDAYPQTRTVDNFILKLRKLVEEDPNQPKHILTVHGIGYKLIV